MPMPRATLAMAAVLMVAAAAPLTTLAAEPAPTYPLKDFFRSSPRAYFRLADDGKTLSFMQPTGDARRRNIFVQALEDG